MPWTCDPCKPAYNLVMRKKRSGKPTNMTFTPCANCRALYRSTPRKSRPRTGPAIPDDMMVQRLLYGPDPGARKIERRAAAVILLRRGHDMHHEIADRVGLHRDSVGRIARELGLSRPKPRAEIEIGAIETRAEIWQLMHRGHSMAGAARSLGIASSTVQRHAQKLREIGVL